MANSEPLVRVSELHARYNESEILHGVDLTLHKGEIVTLLGRNGAGKSTTLKSIIGLIPTRSGSVRLGGAETIKMPARKIARCGIAFCPEHRGIFATLTVYENLMLPPVLQPGGLSVEEIYELFPNLYNRRNSYGTKLSGGEQQMLAIARILRTGSDVLLLDEPTEGLAPVMVQEVGRIIQRLREKRFTVLLVEQNYRFASKVADRHYVLEHGVVVDEIGAAQMASRESDVRAYLGV